MKKPVRKPPAITKIARKIRPHITKKRVLVASLLLFAVLLTIPIATYAYFSRDIADKERLMNRNSTGFVILDKNDDTIYSYGRTSLSNDAKLADISDFTEKAVIASEDEEFYKHDGFSIRGIASAIRANIRSQDATRTGGSTITQQLVKNNLLSAEKNFLRKYQEISMAIAIERHYTKDEILEMYLNSVYFGEGAFGIQQAAEAYFDKPASDLTLAESSMLVGLLPAPSAYSPISGDAKKASEQQTRVLRRMVEAGSISKAEADAVTDKPLKYSQASQDKRSHAQHVIAMVMSKMRQDYTEEEIVRSGFEIKTSLNLKWQKRAESFVRTRINAIKGLGATNAGLVAIDPKTGGIRVLVGSADWNNPDFGKVNMATRPRQPGSSFKPIFYAEALDRKIITAATILKDEPTTFGRTYKPENYDLKYRGDIPVRRALAQSLNIPAVEVMQKLGPSKAAAAAQRMGLDDVDEPEKYGLSLGLGTAEVELLDMANAYAALANEGKQFEPVLITSITDKFDREIFSHQPKAETVISPEASFLVSSILSDNQARAPVFGSSLTIPNRRVAVKTGTTQDNRDAWTMGYTPSLAIGVWVGDNANRPMTNVAGSTGAGPIWLQSMTSFLGSQPSQDFDQPEAIKKSRVCFNGGSYEEYFIEGTEPKDSCKQKIEKPDNDDDKKKKGPKNEDDEDDDDPKNQGRDGEGGRGGDEDDDDDDEDPEEPDEPPDDPDEPPDDNSGPGGD